MFSVYVIFLIVQSLRYREAVLMKSADNFYLVTKNTYLAGCSHSPIYNGMIESLEQYESDLIEFGNPWDLWTEKVSIAKELFAKLISASPNEIAPHFSVSTAFGTLLSAFDFKDRNEILISDLEYPTSSYVALAQEKYGAKVTTLKSDNYRLSPEDYIKSANGKTLLVSAVHVSSLNGFRQDVNKISEISHENGSKIYVDAYQSAGTLDIDVREMDIDFLSAGTLKYLLGLPGLAFLYVREDLVEEMEPAYIGWFSQKEPFKFGAEKLNYQSNADRFQSGTWAIPSLYASIEGLKVILRVGIRDIEAKISSLTRRAIELGTDLNLKTITPIEDKERGAIVSFVVKNPREMEEKLRKERIITSSRGIGLRIAPHFYNTKEEIETAVTRIAELDSN